MNVLEVLAKILRNILTALYEPFGFSLLLSFLAMFSTCMHMSLLQQVKDGRAP